VEKLRTFVIEDNKTILECLVEALVESAPVEIVGTADSERAALDWLASCAASCDVLIVDIFLKAGTGLGVLGGLQELSSKPSNIIVLSNYATSEMRRRCAELGADEVFDKSSELEELLAWFNGLQPT
jgi:DNA-binding NarL/FixJ family response regulator